MITDVIEIKPGNPAQRNLVISGFLVALKAWLQVEEYETAIEKANDFVGRPMLNEVRNPKWIEAQYLLASAHERQAGKLKGSDVEKQKALREARLLASEIVKYPSDVQDDVRALLTRVGFVDVEKKPDDEIIDLATAMEKATAAAQEYMASRETLAKNATEDERREFRKQLGAQRDLALAATQRALELAGQSAEIDKLNQARFLLGYLNWEIARSEANEHNHSTRYYDAAVIGDFLGRRYPDHERARQAVAIAMASYQLLGNQSSETARRAAEADKRTSDDIRRAMDKAIEPWSRHIDEVAQYITGKWPESQEASNAASNLVSIAIQRGEYEKAVALVGLLKAGSPDRADAELRAGRAIWADIIRSGRAADQSTQASDGNPKDQGTGNSDVGFGTGEEATFYAHAKQAQALLESGLADVRKRNAIDRDAVLGLWALIQSYIQTRQPEKAVPWLEDEKIGLLSLVNNKHEAADIEGLTFDAYRLALRTYIGVKPQQLDKATSAMDALERIAGKDDAGGEKLTQVYVSLGRELQKELTALNEGGHTEQVQELTQAFESFLERLVARNTGTNFNSMFWVADTYAELAAGLKQNADQPKSEVLRTQSITLRQSKVLKRFWNVRNRIRCSCRASTWRRCR